MKKILLAGLFSLFAFPSLTMAQVATVADVDTVDQSSCITLSNNMRYRMRDASVNNEVSDLQDFLNMKGYLSSGPTGYFGLATFNAVKKFQSASGFSPTGYVGALTRAKISALSCGGNMTTTPVATPAISTTDTQASGTQASGGGGGGFVTPTTTTTSTTTSLPSGCTSASGFSPLTGRRCFVPAPAPTPVFTNLPAGCTSTAGFSSATGQSCATGIIAQDTYRAAEEARLSGLDATIKSTLSNIRAIAELYYDSHGNYAGVCNDNSGSSNVSKGKSILVSYKVEEVVCRDSANGYAMSARLASPSVGYWCIDSTGASKQTITTLPSGQLSCSVSVTTTTAPSITALSPNGWESIKIGSSLNFIKWNITTPNPVAGNLEISVVNQNTGATTVLLKACTPLIASSQSDCSNFDPITNQFVGFNWVVPSNFPIGQYKVYLMVTDRNTGQKLTSDYSDNSFSLIATTTPTITVLSPNGGEAFSANDSISMKYSVSNLPASTELTAYLYNPINGNIASNLTVGPVSGNGADSIYLALSKVANIPTGQYKITLCALSVPSPVVSFKPLCDSSDNYFTINAATAQTTATSIVEFISTPTLSIQYDSAGKESVLVGKATVKITTGSSPINLGYSQGNYHLAKMLAQFNNELGQAHTNSMVYTAVGSPACVFTADAGCPLPANSSMVFNIENNAKVNELFAGTYYMKLEQFIYYEGNVKMIVPTQDIKGNFVSNKVTIIGETAPYITSAIFDATSGNISISGVRFFNATANTVTINGVTKILPSANAAATLLTAVAKDFGITTSGVYSVQVSTSEGASNMVNVNVTIPTVSAIAPTPVNTTCPQSVVINGTTYTLSPCTITATMVDGQGNKNFTTTLVPTGGSSLNFGYSVRGYGDGFPTYGILGASSGGATGNTPLTFYFNDNYLSADGSNSKIYSGYLPIHIFQGSEGNDNNFLNLNVNLTVNPAITATAVTPSSQFASLIGAFSPVPAPAPVSAPDPAQAWTYEWTRNLEIGSSYADDITALQTALAKEGVYAGEVTGGFYSQTYSAVKAFQKKYGIESTGFVGPATRAKLNELY